MVAQDLVGKSCKLGLSEFGSDGTLNLQDHSDKGSGIEALNFSASIPDRLSL